MAPPLSCTMFSVKSDSIMLDSPPKPLFIAPPSCFALFCLSVDFVRNKFSLLNTAPPSYPAQFWESTDSVRVNSPLLCIAPPS